MNKIFNTAFENSLRVLLILSIEKSAISKDMISIIDFISIYSETLEIGENDLHGKNDFAFCEFTLRRKIIGESVRELVVRGLLTVESRLKGFCYKISQSGREVVDSFQTQYARNYVSSVSTTLDFVKNKNEKKLIEYINSKAIELGAKYE